MNGWIEGNIFANEKRLNMNKKTMLAAVAACVIGCATAKDRVVVVPAHPDDLIPCFGTCLLSKDVFEWHVIEFTHGERGLVLLKGRTFLLQLINTARGKIMSRHGCGG